MVEQIGAMAALPVEFHVQALVEAVKLGDRMDDVMETMIALYVEGRIGMIMPFPSMWRRKMPMPAASMANSRKS